MTSLPPHVRHRPHVIITVCCARDVIELRMVATVALLALWKLAALVPELCQRHSRLEHHLSVKRTRVKKLRCTHNRDQLRVRAWKGF